MVLPVPKKAAVSRRQLEADDCRPEDVASWLPVWVEMLEAGGEFAEITVRMQARNWPRNCCAEAAHRALKSYNSTNQKGTK